MSFNLNKVMLAGNLTREVETREAGQSTLASFAIAINRRYKQGDDMKEETTFVDVEAWGRTAELVAQYLHKGSGCLIEGRLRLETWEDKNGGGKRSKMKVVADSVQFLGGRREGDAGTDDAPAAAPRQRNTKGQAVADARAALSDSDVPF